MLQPGHAEGSEAYVDPLVVKFRDIIEAAEMLTSNSGLRVPVKYLVTTQSVCIYFAGQGKLHYAPTEDDGVFGEFTSGRWFRRVATPLVSNFGWFCPHNQSPIMYDAQLPDGVSLLMLGIFIDGTHLAHDGSTKALPVYLTLGNIDSSVAR